MHRLLLAVALLASAPFARAATLQLDAPRDGAALRGGELAALQWSARDLSAGAEEWEAFLSVDGGRYYAYRITPHLDLARRVTWTVPNVDARDARILIRIGNEERETAFELPQRFTITRNPHIAAELPPVEPAGDAEAARAGDPNVVAWAAGDRGGSRITQESNGRRTLPAAWKIAGDSHEIVTPASHETARASANILVALRIEFGARALADSYARDVPPADLLLVCRRRNV